MKRDMDLVRTILLHAEKAPHGKIPYPLEFEGYSDEQIKYHVYLMVQGGLLDGFIPKVHMSESPEAVARSLTWAGYEFLEAGRDDDTWGKAKAAAHTVRGMSFDVLKSLLVAIATESAKKVVGLP